MSSDLPRQDRQRNECTADLIPKEYEFSEYALPNLGAELRARGVFVSGPNSPNRSDSSPSTPQKPHLKGQPVSGAPVGTAAFSWGGLGGGRLLSTPTQPWIHHVGVKAAADLVIDTVLKNGHTTALDAAAAGVPIVTLPGECTAQKVAHPPRKKCTRNVKIGAII